MRKVIFLDFDGVINTYYFDEFGVGRYNMASDQLVNNWQAICFFNELYKEYNYDIVVSSTWRKLYNIDKLNDILHNSGLNQDIKVIGVTYDLGYESNRIDEINLFVKNLSILYPNHDFYNYVIIDDEYMKDSHFILCNPVGFNLNEFIKVRKKWNKKISINLIFFFGINNCF